MFSQPLDHPDECLSAGRMPAGENKFLINIRGPYLGDTDSLTHFDDIQRTLQVEQSVINTVQPHCTGPSEWKKTEAAHAILSS